MRSCNYYVIACCVALTGCVQKAAMVEYHGNEFYGRERSMASLESGQPQNGRYVPMAQQQFTNSYRSMTEEKFTSAPTYQAVQVEHVTSGDIASAEPQPAPAAAMAPKAQPFARPQQAQPFQPVARQPVQQPFQQPYSQPLSLIKYEKLSPQAGGNIHVVQKGETFYHIAHENGISVNELKAANHLGNNDVLKTGQRLIIPQATTAQAAPPPEVKTAIYHPEENAPVIASSNSRFIRPVEGDVISDFGVKGTGRQNDGINIKAQAGTPVKATAAGKVVYIGALQGYGNMVIISHGDGWMSAYAHNADITVAKNQRVRQGEVIAHVGASGGVKEPQLHFSMRHNNQAVDPQGEFDKQLASAPAI